MHGDMNTWGWMMVVIPMVWIALPALIAWVVWTARPRHGSANPLDLLKQRYAGGQITREQFEQAKKDLE